jgi:hypothetical protein
MKCRLRSRAKSFFERLYAHIPSRRRKPALCGVKRSPSFRVLAKSCLSETKAKSVIPSEVEESLYFLYAAANYDLRQPSIHLAFALVRHLIA